MPDIVRAGGIRMIRESLFCSTVPAKMGPVLPLGPINRQQP
jgi:hypothetical protein